MEIPPAKRIIYKSRADVFSIWVLGDLHLGSASVDEPAIVATVKQIRDDPLALWLSVGDLAEFIPRQDFRFRQSQLAPWLRGLECDYCDDLVKAEIDKVVQYLDPIKSQSLGMLVGNHEDRLLTRFERNAHGEICNQLQVPNLSDEAMLRLLFVRTRLGTSHHIDIYAHHGWFAGRKSGSKVNNLHDLLLGFDVDLAVCGHGHERIVAPPIVTMRRADNGDLVAWRRYAGMTGTFAKSHAVGVTSYASSKGYRAHDLGALCFHYQPDKSRMWSEV